MKLSEWQKRFGISESGEDAVSQAWTQLTRSLHT